MGNWLVALQCKTMILQGRKFVGKGIPKKCKQFDLQRTMMFSQNIITREKCAKKPFFVLFSNQHISSFLVWHIFLTDSKWGTHVSTVVTMFENCLWLNLGSNVSSFSAVCTRTSFRSSVIISSSSRSLYTFDNKIPTDSAISKNLCYYFKYDFRDVKVKNYYLHILLHLCQTEFSFTTYMYKLSFLDTFLDPTHTQKQ